MENYTETFEKFVVGSCDEEERVWLEEVLRNEDALNGLEEKKERLLDGFDRIERKNVRFVRKKPQQEQGQENWKEQDIEQWLSEEGGITMDRLEFLTRLKGSNSTGQEPDLEQEQFFQLKDILLKEIQTFRQLSGEFSERAANEILPWISPVEHEPIGVGPASREVMSEFDELKAKAGENRDLEKRYKSAMEPLGKNTQQETQILLDRLKKQLTIMNA